MQKVDIYLRESQEAPWKVVMLDSAREPQDDRIIVTMKATEQEAQDWIAEQETIETLRYVIIEDINLQRVGDRFKNFQGINFENI